MLHPDLQQVIERDKFDLIVTANLRLARAINHTLAQQAIEQGLIAWRAPTILPWSSWLRSLWEDAHYLGLTDSHQLLSESQYQALWSQIVAQRLRRENRQMLNVQSLASECANSYSLLAQWQLTQIDHDELATDEDCRFFAGALEEFRRIKQANKFVCVDEIAHFLGESGALDSLDIPTRICLAGFDEPNPAQVQFMARSGSDRFEVVNRLASGGSKHTTQMYESIDDEIFAAGQWAHELLSKNAATRIGIVVPGLSGTADRVRRLLSETLMPGWQFSQSAQSSGESSDCLEVSFGRALADYPAIADAYELIALATHAVNFAPLSRLLRSPLLNGDPGVGVALELALRKVPDRRWPVSDFAAWVDKQEQSLPWLDASLELANQASRVSPLSVWAERFAVVLDTAQWLNREKQESTTFQLLNAWREALNRFASLQSVVGDLSLANALTHLQSILSSTIYQAEGSDGAVQVLGPLEAIGLGFDAVRILHLDATRWPMQGSPSSLLPIALQKHHRMPHADAQISFEFSERIIGGLLGSAPLVVLSRANVEDDNELAASAVFSEHADNESALTIEHRYAANRILRSLSCQSVPEQLPRFERGRRLFGGQGWLAAQLVNPFAAMSRARWNLVALEEPALGISNMMRGQLVHGSLERFYKAHSSSSAILAMHENDLAIAIDTATASEFAKYFHDADDLLVKLLRIEEVRTRELLSEFVRLEKTRMPFEVSAVECKRELPAGELQLNIRIDRIDNVVVEGEARALIIDYKTGKADAVGFTPEDLPEKQMQLLVYALTQDALPGGLCIASINRSAKTYVGFSDSTWTPQAPCVGLKSIEVNAGHLRDWRDTLEFLAAQFVQGDLRVAEHLEREKQQPLAVLSRYVVEIEEALNNAG